MNTDIDLPFPLPREIDGKITPLLGSYFYDSLVECLDQAKLSIKIIQYQWKWNIHERHSRVQMLGSTIMRARSRNIPVYVLLHQESERRYISKVNSVTNNALSKFGCVVKMKRTPGLLHTKLWIVDSQYTFVGSHNISTRSLSLNEETSVKIESVPVAMFFGKYFDNLFS